MPLPYSHPKYLGKQASSIGNTPKKCLPSLGNTPIRLESCTTNCTRTVLLRGNLRWLDTVSEKMEIYKSCATAVAMATMTFQNGGYFGFKVI